MIDLEVVAEGVEDIAALNVLREFGCDTVQGWYIGKPVTREMFMQRWCMQIFDPTDDITEEIPYPRGQTRTG
ncbi:EAL domain-containing protein [Sphingorhabdus contaminans]|uniref:EAL domain-containing protein n=1 Tax=Sphingorhabdus contaminans TaxID=1343899 RepID=UPI003D29853D